MEIKQGSVLLTGQWSGQGGRAGTSGPFENSPAAVVPESYSDAVPGTGHVADSRESNVDNEDHGNAIKRENSVSLSEQGDSPSDLVSFRGDGPALARLQARRDRRSSSTKRKGHAQPQIRQMSVLQRGNTDPFNAAGITITPQVNQILAFARDICLPAFYFQDSLRDSSISAASSRDVTNSSGWISSPAARRGWQQVVDALNDKCTALACLSTYLALMAACNINHIRATEASLKMRAGSSALLRQRLFHGNSANTTLEARQELLWQVFWLFYAEFFAGNMEAAQIHGKMLRQSCEAAEEGVITPHFLDSVIFVDSHMSAKYMTRTVLDINEWIPNVFAPIWEEIDPNIASITKEEGADLNHTIFAEPLRSIFIRTRQSLILLRLIAESQTVDFDHDTLFYWLNSHAYVDGGRIIDLYLKLIDKAMYHPDAAKDSLRPGSDSSADSQTCGSIYTQACLCLCALYSLRDIGQEITINGNDIVDASSSISKHLRDAIIQALTTCTTAERKKYLPSHLWCAYVGALIEQRGAENTSRSSTQTSHSSKSRPEAMLKTSKTLPELPSSTMISSLRDPSYMPFNSLFAELAHNMTLLGWQQVSDVLKQFIYTDTSEPHGSRWFWRTMGAYLDRRRKRQDLKEQVSVLTDRIKSQEPNTSTLSAINQAMNMDQVHPQSPRRWSTAEGITAPSSFAQQKPRSFSKR